MVHRPRISRQASRVSKVLAVPLTVAWLFGLFAAGAALGHTTYWNATCNDGELCVYGDRDLQGPMSAISNHMHVYSGQYKSPLGTGVNINNSVTSLQNRFAALDATFYMDTEFTGNSICYDSWLAYYWVGFFHDNTYSSHNVHTTDNFC